MVITNNLLAMNAQRQYKINTTSKQKSTEKLSSGFRINRAADDAAGLTISEKMRSMIRGLNQGTENTHDGISWVQVADGAMEEVHDMLHRLTELSIKAANGTLTDADREAINKEAVQIKNEIDRIDQSTQFNTKDIFLKGNVQLSVDGRMNDIDVFDATYDLATGDVTYGGFIFDGKRVNWNMIDSGSMVRIENGVQVFNQGTYSYTSADNYHFQFVVEDGTKVPQITRRVELFASDNGLTIDGYRVNWSDVKDKNGVGISANNIHSGTFTAPYGKGNSTAVLTISIAENYHVSSLNDIINSINSGNDGVFEYNWIETYDGPYTEKAVNIYNNQNGNCAYSQNVTQAMAYNSECIDNDGNAKIQYTLHVDQSDPNNLGLYLTGSNGNVVTGSEMSFTELLGNSITADGWIRGDEIAENKVYTYTDRSGKTGVSFDFTLSDVTSMDSVIDGLDGVVFGTPRYTVNYTNKIITDPSYSKVRVTNPGQNLLAMDYNKETQLNRNFERNYGANDYLAQSNVAYNGNTLSFEINSADGTKNLLRFNASTSASEQAVYNRLAADISGVYNWKANELLNGRNQDVYPDFSNKSISLTFTDNASPDKKLVYSYDYTDFLNDLKDSIQADWNADHSQVEEKFVATGLVQTIAPGAATKEDAINAFKKYVMNEIANASTYTVHPDTLSSVRINGDEHVNRAVGALYASEMELKPLEKGIRIQHFGIEDDFTIIPQFAINTNILCIKNTDLSTINGARKALERIEYAVDYISSKRSTLGACQNRLEHTLNNNENKAENTTAAESRIRDTDMAREMVEFTKLGVLGQVGEAMIAQANLSRQGVLQLLSA